MSTTCKTCKHFLQADIQMVDPRTRMPVLGQKQDAGACRRYPPVPLPGGASGIPITMADNTCGEYSANAQEASPAAKLTKLPKATE